jgi:hypothetical protein
MQTPWSADLNTHDPFVPRLFEVSGDSRGINPQIACYARLGLTV